MVKAMIDPSFTNDIDNCKWDAEKQILTTPQDEENEMSAAMEQAAWYKDAFGENAFDMSRKEKKQQLSVKKLEDLHVECSVKTLTKKPGRYEGSPGEETFVVGKKKATDTSVATRGTTDDLNKLTREELLRTLRGAHISPQKMGSQPKDSRAGANGSDTGESLSSGKQSSTGSSSSSSSSSLSSGGGKSQARSPAPDE